jgi:hypothetical protein
MVQMTINRRLFVTFIVFISLIHHDNCQQIIDDFITSASASCGLRPIGCNLICRFGFQWSSSFDQRQRTCICQCFDDPCQVSNYLC